MAKDYSLELRSHITDAISGGLSCRAAAKQFAVAASIAIRYSQRLQCTGSLAPDRRVRAVGRGKLDPHRERMIAKIEEKPDIAMPDLTIWLLEQTRVKVDPSHLSRLLCKAGYTYKKQLPASEQERSDVKLERNEWKQSRLIRASCVYIGSYPQDLT